eukprot:TRINITY_DN4545_c0_g1_i1.p1 TRINITY_DN4545_c0_g1~~TRINITY_DN4545_c0_g1_i1.p1  ORF type:complete len:525 (+),score=61.35 TRINITY_DN4545_c0_g1_i1:61-1635(+)
MDTTPPLNSGFLHGVPLIKRNELSLERTIGEGQYGKVWQGKCRGEVVAVKILNNQEWDDEIIKQFEKEVEIMSQLRHPNVALLMGACTEEKGKLAIVTELCKSNLRSVVHNNKIKLSLLQKLKFCIDIAQGMAWLHNTKPHQIIHRDLKLTNLLVGENWKVKVSDFGLSDILKADYLMDNEGGAVGSALWMSPEVLEGKELTDKLDIYSFGLVMWEIFTRVQPFEEYKTVSELKEAVCKRNERPPFSKHQIPSVIAGIMEQCWQSDPRKRPPFVEVLELLRDAIVDVFLTPVCPDASKLWKLEKRWKGKDMVKFDSFIRALCKYLRITYAEKQLELRCFKALVASEKIKGVDDTQMISIERLGLVLAWFGPMLAYPWEKGGVTFLDRILELLQYGWFFGDIEREEAENLLRDFKKKPGTFLVRCNLGGQVEPTTSPFTLSLVNKNSLEHLRIYQTKERTGYYLQIKTKSGTKQITTEGSLSQLIVKLKQKGALKKDGAVPGQKYKAFFDEFGGIYYGESDVNID